TSALVSRPSLPVGVNFVTSIWVSAASFRTAGPERARRSAPLPEDDAAGDAAGGGAGCGAGAGAAFGAAAGLAEAVAFAPPSPIRPSTAPTATLLPSPATTSVSVPAAGALTSSVTLSVSSSTSGSSIATTSPGCFSQRATVASVTDSPSAGTLISVGML